MGVGSVAKNEICEIATTLQPHQTAQIPFADDRYLCRTDPVAVHFVVDPSLRTVL